MFVIWAVSSSSFSAMKPPMFTSPSFFADIVHPSANAKNAFAIAGMLWFRSLRTLLKYAFSANRQAS